MLYHEYDCLSVVHAWQDSRHGLGFYTHCRRKRLIHHLLKAW